MISQPKLILFDLDGTLVDSAPDLAYAVNATLMEIGRETFSSEIITTWVGNGAKMLLRRALAGDSSGDIPANEDADLLDTTLPIFMRHYEANLSGRSELYADVQVTLETLRKKEIRMACVTNKPERFTYPLLHALGISEYFDVVIGGDTLAVLKPDPEPLLVACERLGISRKQAPQQVVMIGDSANDIHAANSAGINCIALSYGYAQGFDLSQLGATCVIDNFAEILDNLSIT